MARSENLLASVLAYDADTSGSIAGHVRFDNTAIRVGSTDLMIEFGTGTGETVGLTFDETRSLARWWRRRRLVAVVGVVALAIQSLETLLILLPRA